MRFSDGETEYSFSPGRYEDPDLGSIDYDVEIVDTHGEVFEALMDSGSCIERESEALQQGYAETFAQNDDVHIYSIGDQGYARALEFPTSEGDALAVDAVKTGPNFDTERYRAGVNSIFRHAESMEKDLVLGGNMFFRHRWEQDLDLTREETETNPADQVFFDQKISQEDLDISYDQRPHEKGESWDRMDSFFVQDL